MKGINIWSGCSIGIGAALTNPTELAFRKGNLKNHYPVEFKGRVFRDAEAAYQNHKFGHLQQDMTLTLSGLKTLRFLRDCAINIPIARVPKLSTLARFERTDIFWAFRRRIAKFRGVPTYYLAKSSML